jgi:hypothetical protein
MFLKISCIVQIDSCWPTSSQKHEIEDKNIQPNKAFEQSGRRTKDKTSLVSIVSSNPLCTTQDQHGLLPKPSSTLKKGFFDVKSKHNLSLQTKKTKKTKDIPIIRPTTPHIDKQQKLKCMITTITPLKCWGELTINLLDMNSLLSYFIFESMY